VPALAELSDAGGWAVFAFSVFWLGIALQRRWIVPGWIYTQERDQRLKAETQAERNSDQLGVLSRAASDAHAILAERAAAEARVPGASGHA
jgi:hypothetical protein